MRLVHPWISMPNLLPLNLRHQLLLLVNTLKLLCRKFSHILEEVLDIGDVLISLQSSQNIHDSQLFALILDYCRSDVGFGLEYVLLNHIAIQINISH